MVDMGIFLYHRFYFDSISKKLQHLAFVTVFFVEKLRSLEWHSSIYLHIYHSNPTFFSDQFRVIKRKKALALKNFTTAEVAYDGRQPDKNLGFKTIPEMNLSFGGTTYDVAASLHGSMELLPKIRDKLETGEIYRISVSEGVILKIESVN